MILESDKQTGAVQKHYIDCMEVFSKGIHRALIPLDSHMENISGVELTESSSSYKMLTQMDVLHFLKTYQSKLKNVIIVELGAITEDVFAVNNNSKVIEAIKCMRTASLNAVPIVKALDATNTVHTQLLNGKGRKLIGTFSATEKVESSYLLRVSVIEFTEKTANGPMKTDGDHVGRSL
ncbi:Snf1-related protein kinase regulatory subunit gamma-like pv42a [Thalictrum thalictroides]|uniref:Snf1-related protein kinase regulatory subunit gamma-like pv42a n=1 Tax=Thalictrum thalictroides TaxID=46969 RepID=A0A7J6WUD9_THATH|nr:Snf1-related protein kinase regulatory subunit gamma-like pv42a [Thalictrum thalictroides]